MIRSTFVFELVFTVLALFSVSLLIYEVSFDITEETAKIIVRMDFWIATLFLVDFFIGLTLVDNNKRYMKDNWYMLLASIPINEYAFRSLRVLRILRIFRATSVLSRTVYIRRNLPNWLKGIGRKLRR